ncbi:MAG: DNA alkylation repair protein [Luteolibacter sp.]
MEPFKEHFSYAKARAIAVEIQRVHPGFDMKAFTRGLEKKLAPLELKQRMHAVADHIEAALPLDAPSLFVVLIKALADEKGRGLSGFAVWPLTELVARHGLNHFAESMDALAQMTMRFTAEFAIRPFIRHHREKTLRQLQRWCKHPNEHVRRLASEGSRPFLPWGGNIPELLDSPYETLEILETLHRDPSDYVRLSVANHLNDFSKGNAKLVIETLTRWRKAAPHDPQLEKLSRHACRTLLKKGHPAALKLHGYGTADSLEIESLKLNATSVRVGEKIGYQIVIRNHSRQLLRVMFDYAIHHRKAKGTLSAKVFKGRVKELAAGESWEIQGTHSFRPVTTRVYHAGRHQFEPRLNGRVFSAQEFMLKL